MQNILYSANITLPVLLSIALGALLKKTRLIDDHFATVASKLTFRVAIPISLFYGIYSSGMGEGFNIPLVLFACVGIAASALLLLLVVPRFLKDRGKAAALIQGIYRSNFVLVAVPLVTNAFGPAAAAVVSSVMPFAVSLFNIFAVMIFSVLVDQGGEKGSLWKRIPLGIVQNPLVVACILALIATATGLKMPYMLERSLSTIGGMATPLALIALGAQIDLGSMRQNALLVSIGALGRCLILPSIMTMLAVALGFRGVELLLLFTLFGAPTAVSSYVMALEMGGDGPVSAGIIAASTLLSTLTLTGGHRLSQDHGLDLSTIS